MQRRWTDANLTEREPRWWPWERWLGGGTRYGQTAWGDADRSEGLKGAEVAPLYRRQVAREESPAAFAVHACGTAGERNATFKTARCTYVGLSGVMIVHKGRAWIRLGLGVQVARFAVVDVSFGDVESDVGHEQEARG
ncbi:hypothetical protein B0H13DRAFT_1865984 [Mycena leptocephala]|nr:hypothetical protein B0H13DRAFT_1865984 [Mycena leptocephala]